MYNQDGSLATLFSDNATPPTSLANPVYTDPLGFFSFYVANGRYNLVLVKQGFDNVTIKDVEINDLTGFDTDLTTKVQQAIVGYFAANPVSVGPGGPPGPGVPKSGTAGQVLKKASNNDFDTFWATEQQASGNRPVVLLAADSSGNVLMDNALSNNFQLVLHTDVTLLAPVNYLPTDSNIDLIFAQDAVGGHKISFDPSFVVIGGVPQFDTTANLVNRMHFSRMADGRWVVTPFFLSQPGSNVPPSTGGGSGGTGETLLATYPWETSTIPVVATDTKLDATTLAAYQSAANGASIGTKRTAGANAIISAMGSAYSMTLSQGGNARAVINYNTPLTVATQGSDIVIGMGNVASITGITAGAIAQGIWTATIANAAGRSITMTLGTLNGTQQLHLDRDTAPGIGLRPEAVTLTMPRPLDGLV